ncbi:NTF2-related export protein [Caenorhabditis elegans]|uniref:NTF2-related export protein n=1 Tax=Caenorhabditis elegans TaxID=6239 RepID=NXT1_CAEEL|nr:NTF2-related export protein [Caenorhabditis elegans]Q9U757.1 RecName: Full=NTF2-related export protein [Caenorhabditis elegans]AAD54945.1 NTF2-related export protein NXT1 [Caenorhabditis elegans]CCD73516.1 NTF2-related export protein [Caenorhabditis elegans]|eukprot:NP_491077.1 NTF2-related export protein [Caenorhabditis elegans]
MSMKTTQEINKEDEELCNESKKFMDVYYDVMDRKREKIGFLYTQVSNAVWNGNPINGYDSICEFMKALPSTQHDIQSLDAQRLPEGVTGDMSGGMLLNVAGAVTVDGDSKRAFTQTLLLGVEDGKYKVKSDRFRYVD